MSKRDYENLIKKYSVPVQGEKLTKKQLRDKKQYQRKTRYKQIAENFMSLDNLNLKGELREQVYYIIENVKLKELNHNLSIERIILCIIFYIMKSDNSGVVYKRYPIFKEYDLNVNMILTVWCRLLDYYRSKMVIKPIPTTNYNHELLYNHGVKLR